LGGRSCGSKRCGPRLTRSNRIAREPNMLPDLSMRLLLVLVRFFELSISVNHAARQGMHIVEQGCGTRDIEPTRGIKATVAKTVCQNRNVLAFSKNVDCRDWHTHARIHVAVNAACRQTVRMREARRADTPVLTKVSLHVSRLYQVCRTG
jgi:hypothetical protein